MILRILMAVIAVAMSVGSALAQDMGPLRRIVVSADMAAPAADVWKDWTTDEGIQSFFAPGSKIELKPGGAYEVYFMVDAEPGQKGSEGTTVLGYQDGRMLSVTWALPPYMPKVRPHLTPLSFYFEPLGEKRTRVTVVHAGWGEGPDWDQAYNYFVDAWPQVLANQQKKYSAK